MPAFSRAGGARCRRTCRAGAHARSFLAAADTHLFGEACRRFWVGADHGGGGAVGTSYTCRRSSWAPRRHPHRRWTARCQGETQAPVATDPHPGTPESSRPALPRLRSAKPGLHLKLLRAVSTISGLGSANLRAALPRTWRIGADRVSGIRFPLSVFQWAARL